MNVGIPTTYKGVRFRSRLEATWASFFDKIGWPWEYEPFDLNGYIPDFVLPFEHRRKDDLVSVPLLIEVKPFMAIEEAQQFTDKIEKSGWSHESLIVGSRIPSARNWSNLSAGLLSESCIDHESRPAWSWEEGAFFECSFCRRTSVFHTIMSFRCRVCGQADGDHHLGGGDDHDASIVRAWREARNVTQWRAQR